MDGYVSYVCGYLEKLSDAKVQKANLSITGRHVSMYQIIK